MTVPAKVETLINKIALKLPCKTLVGYQERQELVVWNMQVRTYAVPVYDTLDKFMKHVRKMKLAWLAEGKTGLMRYVEKYVNPASLKKIRAIIFSSGVPKARFPLPPTPPKDRIIRDGFIANEPPPKR